MVPRARAAACAPRFLAALVDKAIQVPSGSAAEALAAGIVSVQPVHTKTTVVTLTSSTVCTALNQNDNEESGGQTLGPPWVSSSQNSFSKL